jgi:hypothetical protein
MAYVGYDRYLDSTGRTLMPHHYREEEPRQIGDKKTNHLLI